MSVVAALLLTSAEPSITAQEYHGIPNSLAHTADDTDRRPTAEEIQTNYHALMANPDTSLDHDKRLRMRWMTHVFSNFNFDENGNPRRKGSTDALKAIANKPKGGTAAARADNVLCFFFGICKPSPGYLKSAPGQQRKPKPALDKLLAEQNHVTARPNPADAYIELEYVLLFEKENTFLKVWDAQGRQVETWHLGRSKQGLKLLDTRHLAAGVYVTEVLQDGKQVFSDKFIVRH